MTDEDFVFKVDTFADKTVAGDFAIAPNARAFLNLNKRSDGRTIADFAAVEIYEMMNFRSRPSLTSGAITQN